MGRNRWVFAVGFNRISLQSLLAPQSRGAGVEC
jgi:hypothetical protein